MLHDETPAAATGQEDLLETARRRFDLVVNSESKLRVQMLDDLKFFDGDQWPEDVKTARERDGRPVLTFPVLQQFVHQVSNEIRQNKPAPVVRPVDDGGDVDTAEVFMGIIRSIERNSKADTARSYAGLYAVICGRGWYRLVTEFESDDSFDQVIKCRRIKNQSSVYADPMCVEPDYSDMQFCFVVEDFLIEEFHRTFPNAEAISEHTFQALGDSGKNWIMGDTCRVAEYFYIEHTPVEIALVATFEGETMVMPLDEVAEGMTVLKQRTVQKRVVKWCKLNGNEILEEGEWPGKWIPIIPVLGEELEIDGETKLSGMVRPAKHAQIQYNYMRTMQTETIALAPRAPYIAAAGQIEDFEDEWATAHSKNHAVLRYNPVDINGHPVPPPSRTQYDPAIQSATLAVREAYEDLKRATGIHDASLGARSNESSGRAIIARQQEGDTANWHYQDNLVTSVTHECRMYVDLIPKIYDRPGRVLQILGEDDNEKTAVLNQPFEEKGVAKIYDLGAGRYDVAMTVGPSATTKRQVAGELLMELTRAYPQLMQVAGDVIIKTLDIPGAREIGERLKKLLPPEIQENDEEMPVPPQVQQQLAQASQMIDALSQEVEKLSEVIKTKRIETDSKERIVSMQLRADLVKTEAQLMSAEGLEVLRQEIGILKAQLDAQMLEEQQQEAQQEYPAAA